MNADDHPRRPGNAASRPSDAPASRTPHANWTLDPARRPPLPPQRSPRTVPVGGRAAVPRLHGTEAAKQPNDRRPMPTASFALRPEQIDQIRRLAQERGTSQSAIVRDAIDLLFRDLVGQALDHLGRSRQADPSVAAADRPTPRRDR